MGCSSSSSSAADPLPVASSQAAALEEVADKDELKDRMARLSQAGGGNALKQLGSLTPELADEFKRRGLTKNEEAGSPPPPPTPVSADLAAAMAELRAECLALPSSRGLLPSFFTENNGVYKAYADLTTKQLKALAKTHGVAVSKEASKEDCLAAIAQHREAHNPTVTSRAEAMIACVLGAGGSFNTDEGHQLLSAAVWARNEDLVPVLVRAGCEVNRKTYSNPRCPSLLRHAAVE